MKKKLLALAVVLILGLQLMACGSSSETTYGGYTAEQIETSMESTASQLAATTAEEAAYYAEYYQDSDTESSELTITMLSDWAEIADETGEFIQFSDFSIEKTGKTTTATLTMDFTQRDAKLIFVFNSSSMNITAVNCELVYTLGETMEKAALNTVMGISIVFLMLILICLIISCFSFIPKIQNAFSGKGKKTDEPAAPKSEPAAVKRTEEVKSEAIEDLELVAVIAAAIAASTGTSTDSFVVRSIKKRR